MLSKFRMRSSRQTIFILLTVFTLIFIYIHYKSNSEVSKREFEQYEEEYYTEQAYTLGYILNLMVTDDLASEENKQLYRSLSRKFVMRIELLTEDLDEVIYPTDQDRLLGESDNYVEMPIVTNGSVLGYLRVYYNMDSPFTSPALVKLRSETAKRERIIFEIIGVIVVIISFMTAFKVTKPMKISAQDAQKILNGDREERIPRRGSRELNQLIDTINGLSIESNQVEVLRIRMMEDLIHELRTPITSALMTMEAIIDGVYPNTTNNLEGIYNELDRLSRLIINMQKLSEAERAGLQLNIKETNIIQLVRGSYEGLLFLAQQKDIKMELKYPTRPMKADIDPDRFIQVITNIISNAITHTDIGGKIELGLDSDDEYFVFYCLDNGVGISEENQKLIFNRFYRTDKSRSRQNGGSGIGLNIASSLVQAHNGEMGVDSRLGEGSRFWVKLPINRP